MDANLGGPFAKSLTRRGFGEAVAFDPDVLDQRSMHFRQRRENPPEVAASERFLRSLGCLRGDSFNRNCALAPGPAQMIDQFVARDRIGPGGEGQAAVIGRALRVDGEKAFLSEVFRILSRQAPLVIIEEMIAHLGQQGARRLHVAIQRSKHQLSKVPLSIDHTQPIRPTTAKSYRLRRQPEK